MEERVAAMSAASFHDQPVPDVDLLLLRFAGGGLATLTSAGYRDTTGVNDTEIVGENGILRLDLTRGVEIGQGGQWTSLPGAMEPDWLRHGLAREWQAMRAAIRHGVPPPVGAAEAAALIACITAAETATITGREQAVPVWPLRGPAGGG